MGFFRHKATYDYFGGFIRSAEAAVEAADYLNRALNGFDVSQIEKHIAEMHKIENRADAYKHEMTSKLAHEFLPPIEFEDISLLSQQLDDVVDSIEDVMRQIYMHNVSSLRSEVPAFCSLIVRCAEAYEKLIREFANFKKSKAITPCIISINTLESTGDKLHEKSLKRLFAEEANPVELIVWSTIFEGLEKSLDSFEDAADLVESVVMKNT